MNGYFKNERAIGESFNDYRTRLRVNAKAVKMYLRAGVPATPRREMRITPHCPKVPCVYKPGPHKPHDVKATAMILNPHGVPELREFTVHHPGTLYRVPA
jgi:hypothetical protein